MQEQGLYNADICIKFYSDIEAGVIIRNQMSFTLLGGLECGNAASIDTSQGHLEVPAKSVNDYIVF